MSEASQKRYLSCISEQFPTVQSLYTEIINLKAILNLPKGTEHFMSDIHGEYDAFLHILNNCSGVVREKALLLFSSTHSAAAISDLLTLIYYPKEKLKLLGAAGRLSKGWYNATLHDLIELSRLLSSKYTRSKVRKAMPSAYAYILDELLHALPDEDDNQLVYHQKIIDALIDIGSGDEFIVALCSLIKRLAVDRLHIVGDIYDRGPHADGIMDLLLNHHAVDIEWGNHDILWMGSAAGNPVCMAAVVRGCLQYDNMELLETGYGISLRSLALFASQNYPGLTEAQAGLQAITVILFKLEGQIIARHPEYGMEGRRLLHLLVKNSESISLSGRIYPLRPVALPTVDPADPYRLTAGEEAVVRDLSASFAKSERLRRHVRFLYDNGRLYRCYNGNLLFHGCIPMTEAGDFDQVTFDGECYQGRALMDHHERMARRAYFDRAPDAVDFMWYLWCGERSPLCGRSIKTFERAFVNCPEAWQEPMNPYYRHINDEAVCRRILSAFGLDSPEAHIINGHTPIHVSSGESPVKANGRLIVIDGGFCKAYQKATGIAGYTLISNSHGLRIVAHQPFSSLTRVLDANDDIHSDSQILWQNRRRCLVADTDNGRQIQQRIRTLEELLNAYRSGLLTPRGE